MKKLLLVVRCGLFCVVDVMPQKTIGFESLVIEKSGAVNIYWEKNKKNSKSKTLDGNYRILFKTYHMTGKFTKGFPIDTLRAYTNTPDGMETAEDGILLLEYVYDKAGHQHGMQRLFYKDNGQIKSEHPYVHGILEGTAREWHPNGNLKSCVEMNNGKINGISFGWDEEGNPLSEWHYTDGERDGVCRMWIYTDDGETFVNEEHYKNGLQADSTCYYRINPDASKTLRCRTTYAGKGSAVKFESFDGDTYSVREMEDGKDRLWTQYILGRLSAREEYKDGKPHGESIIYYPGTDKRWKISMFDQGELLWQKEYSIDGKLIDSKGLEQTQEKTQ